MARSEGDKGRKKQEAREVTEARIAMWNALLSHDSLRPLLHIVHFLYALPSQVVVFDGADPIAIFDSVCGSRQGCVFGSLLFDLSVQQPYEALAASHLDSKFIAIHDDLTIAASAPDPPSITRAFSAFDDVGVKLAPGKTVLNLEKCTTFWPHSSVPTRYTVRVLLSVTVSTLPNWLLRLSGETSRHLLYASSIHTTHS